MVHLCPNIRWDYRYQPGCRNKRTQTKSVNNNWGKFLSEFKSATFGGAWAEQKQIDGCVSLLSIIFIGKGVFAGSGKGVCPNLSLRKKTRGWWPRWFFSSRGKPRSQWVWPTAAHLEPMRPGEDLRREEEKLSQRGIPQCAKHHLSSSVSPRCSWVAAGPRVLLLT